MYNRKYILPLVALTGGGSGERARHRPVLVAGWWRGSGVGMCKGGGVVSGVLLTLHVYIPEKGGKAKRVKLQMRGVNYVMLISYTHDEKKMLINGKGEKGLLNIPNARSYF